MPWIHCSIETGAIITVSDDDHFNADNCSETMCKRFINIYTDMTIEEARKYKGPIFDEDDGVVSKYSYKIDLMKVVPEEYCNCIKDREKTVPLITKNLDKTLITPLTPS